MPDPEISFFVDSELKSELDSCDSLSRAMVAMPSRAGEIAHVAQTHRLLAGLGVAANLVDRLPDKGIVVCHRRSFPPDYRAPADVFVVYCKGDWDVHYYANLHVIQNSLDMSTLDASLFNRRFLPHFGQPDLLPRDSRRGDLFENVAYVGDLENLAPQLSSERFRDDLSSMGLGWSLREHADWHDYSQVDAVVAVRSFSCDHDLFSKPATKLFNAWLAGVPAILGAEPAYRSYRRNELDYIEVESYEQVLAALARLKSDASLRRRMSAHGKERGGEVSAGAISLIWRDFLYDEVVVEYERWRALAPACRLEFFRRRAAVELVNSKRRKLRELVTGEPVLLSYV